MNSWLAWTIGCRHIYLCCLQVAWISLHVEGLLGRVSITQWEGNPRQWLVSLAAPAPALAPASLDPGEKYSHGCHDLGLSRSFLFWLVFQHASLETPVMSFSPALLSCLSFYFPLTTKRKRGNIFKTYKVPQNIYPWICWEQTIFLCFNQACFWWVLYFMLKETDGIMTHYLNSTLAEVLVLCEPSWTIRDPFGWLGLSIT